jgi:hypothetical protein
MKTLPQTTAFATLLRKAIRQAQDARLEAEGYDDYLREVLAEDERLEKAAGEALEMEEVNPLVLPKWVSRMNDFSMFTDEEVELLESNGRYGVANEG